MEKIWNVSKKTEFILHAGVALKSWFCDFLTSCMCQLKIPNIWIRALIVAIPKPGKALGNPKSYRPISLLWNDRSAVDQVTLLTQDIEDSFSAKRRPELCLSTSKQPTTDIVWYCGLTCKLLQLLPDRHMIQMIMEMVGNRRFTLTTGNGTRSRLQRLKNGVSQGSVLAPLLLNI